MLMVPAASPAAICCAPVWRKSSTFKHRAAPWSAKRFASIKVTGWLITTRVIVDATALFTPLLDCAGIEPGPAVQQLKAKQQAQGALHQTRFCPAGEDWSSSMAAPANPHCEVGLIPMGQDARTPDVSAPTDHSKHCFPK